MEVGKEKEANFFFVLGFFVFHTKGMSYEWYEMMNVSSIYKIVAGGKVYIGCTKQDPEIRYGQHLYAVRHGSRLKVHSHMRAVGVDECRMEVLRRVVDADRETLRRYEDMAIHAHDSVANGLNSCYASSICFHGIERKHCTPCGGALSRCDHGVFRAICKSYCCESPGLCEHQKQKAKCKICLAGRFTCELCERTYAGKQSLEKHNASIKHVLRVAEVALNGE